MITNIRFRAEGEKVLLQVEFQEPRRYAPYESDAVWRDAKVEDLMNVARFFRFDFDKQITSINDQIETLREDIRNIIGTLQVNP